MHAGSTAVISLVLSALSLPDVRDAKWCIGELILLVTLCPLDFWALDLNADYKKRPSKRGEFEMQDQWGASLQLDSSHRHLRQ